MATAADTTRTTRWSIDRDHSQVGFSVRHMMFATVKGRFLEYSDEVEIDEQDLARSRVRIAIRAASIDTGVGQRDAHLRSADFLDAEQHRELTFESRSIRPSGKGRFELVGALTIRGTTREVTLQVEEQGRGVDPWGGQRVGYTASGTIDRTDYGLTWNQALEAGGVLVSNEIRLVIDVQLVPAD
jgi:polyisoprenoid-binding protein YceI